MLIPSLLLAFAASGEAPPLELARPPVWTQDSVEIDKSKVRYGNFADFDATKGHKVATVRSTDVYQQIPSYQTIVKEGIERGTARWNQLMKEATAHYKRALKSVATAGSYVLVVEEGAISGYSTTDATTAIIDAL
ncbi:MAG: hypothetical protein ISR76_03685 [Planctomycetes bacterium]|nr:hypothetical protein [Planctomycetota bacterium]MBL7008073.1 hypothetical protein [Planctomycetota bacterium]